ncbi:hypothetical protein JL721_12617 [Aureococcus anophagefferens]|nr:hypothetical protein JL721_12617 [Aureococcus anophagefferens]
MDCDASTDDDDYYEWLRAPDSDEDVSQADDDDRAAPEPLEHRLSTGSATNEVAAIDSIAVEDSLSQTLHSPAARPAGAGRGRDVLTSLGVLPARTSTSSPSTRSRPRGRSGRSPRATSGAASRLPASWAALSSGSAFGEPAAPLASALFKFPLDGAKTPLAASLVALDLSRNLLVDVPASVGCLGALEALDLRDNSLATVDDALFSSPPSLRRLDLSSNPNLVDLPPTVAAFVSRPGSSLLRATAQLQRAVRGRAREPPAPRTSAWRRRRRPADGGGGGDAAAASEPFDGRRIATLALLLERQAEAADAEPPASPSSPPPPPAARGRRRAAAPASTPLASRKSSPALSPLTSRKSSPALSRTKKPRSARAIRRAASEPELASGPEPEATLGERRAAQARLDLEEARLALRRLGAGDDDGGEEIEILACFCLPKTIIVHKEGHPSDGKRVPLNANAQLELMREVTGLIEAVPSSQREIVPATRWNAGGSSLLFQRDVSRRRRQRRVPDAITPEPGEFVAVLERCGDNLELCFLNACASVAIARRIVHDLPNEAYDAAVAAFKQKYVVGNPHPTRGLGGAPAARDAQGRGRGLGAEPRAGMVCVQFEVTPTKSHRRESSPQWPADRAVGASRGAQSAMAC